MTIHFSEESVTVKNTLKYKGFWLLSHCHTPYKYRQFYYLSFFLEKNIYPLYREWD